MPTLTREVAKDSPLHKKLTKEILSRKRTAEIEQEKRHKKWREAEERILAYVPESELDSKRRLRRERGEPTYTTIQIPYTYALLMSAHTYWTSVFFARSPVHQFMGLHGEGEQQVQALEAIMNYQVTVGEMLGPYYIWLYDGGKYGCGVLGNYWTKRVIYYTEITEEPEASGVPGMAMPEPKMQRFQTTRELPAYEGNTVYNVSPFDFYPDPRMPVGLFQKGEFCFVRRRVSWNEIIRRKNDGYYTNIEFITSVVGTVDPTEESRSVLERPLSTRQMMTDTTDKHPSMVELMEFYIELIPKEWNLGPSPYPEKWVITATWDATLILGLQPLGMMHDQFPFDVIETEIEAYGSYNRGLPEIVEPLQQTMDWLLNTHFYNTRAALNNLFLVDPTKVVMKDFDTAEPGGFIRLKPEAYGADLRTFFMQIPIQNITQQNFTDLGVMQQFGERALGINDQIMGASMGGGRKTATEVRSSVGFGINRLKTITEYISATAFSSHARKLVTNTQQFYSAEKKFRLVGSLAQEAGEPFINVRPEDISGSFGFVQVDGVLPVDRMMQANLWKEILMNIGRVPVIAQQYDMSRIFAWMASLAGLKNISQFKVQVLPPGVGPSPGMVASPNGMMPQSNPTTTGMTNPVNEME